MKRYLFYISELYAFAIVRPLQKIILERGDEVAWFFDDPERLSIHLRPSERRLSTVAEVKAYNPCAVLVPGNVVPDFFPGIKVELFHGFNARKRNSDRGHFRIRNFFDLYCTQGPDTTGPFKELEQRLGFFEVHETGWPKMDPLFWDDASDDSLVKNRPKVLFTSTFTPRLSAAPVLADTVEKLVKTGRYQWVVNFHPKMDPKVVDRYRAMQGDDLAYVDTDDILPLLKSADIMVSDTSSVLSEFLLQGRPVVTFNNREPGPHLINITDPEHLEQSIAHGLTHPPDLMDRIQSYTDHIHPYRDGQSSLRVLAAADALVQKGLGHLKPKPFNLGRRLKGRMQLGYYWF
ncbi:MAG: CDP-glycerol glycerophosphotransferase family protein [Desulfosalsimonadaceae bacterium]